MMSGLIANKRHDVEESVETKRPRNQVMRLRAAQRTAQSPQLSLSGFGRAKVSINSDGSECQLSRKGRGILFLLAMNAASGVHKEVLMDTFWRGSFIASARNCLNVTLHGLRHHLNASGEAQEWLIYREEHYRLNPQIKLWFDTRQFEHHLHCAHKHEQRVNLRAAISHYCLALKSYTGDFMANEPYADWADEERTRLQERYLCALEQLALLFENIGYISEASERWQDILQRDSCREDAHRGLMRCYARQGKRERALRQFARCTKALSDEYAITPDHPTKTLLKHIRSGEELDPPPLVSKASR